MVYKYVYEEKGGRERGGRRKGTVRMCMLGKKRGREGERGMSSTRVSYK